MSWSISEIFKPFKILATLYYQVKNSRRSQEFLNPIICHSCSFFKEYKNNQVSNEHYIPKHLLKASSILQKITCKKVISVIDSWGAFHYGKISETFRVKWKDFPVIGSHLQSHCSLEPKIQQDVCYSTADTMSLRQLQQRNWNFIQKRN